LIDLNQRFKTVTKDQLFYGQYEYCFGFYLPEANVMRGIKQRDLIDRKLDQRIEWREASKKRLHTGIAGTSSNVITEQVRRDLHTIADIVLAADCKLVVSTNFGWVYTNDLEVIDQLRIIRCLKNKTYTQAVINRPKNTVLLKKSRYQNRSYFLNLKLSPAEKETLKNFFTNQREYVRTSPSFTEWLYKQPYLRTQDYFFMDYTGEQWMTMLCLIRPGLIRRSLDIITK
jgi:hypothetical protein